jgi:predicted nucleic acid-binding protein
MRVIADTTPLNYLVLVDVIDVLPQLYGHVVAPRAVVQELGDPEAPAAVRSWISNPPAWLDVRPMVAADLAFVKTTLGAGEREVISLALAIGADMVLIDDRAGRREAARHHIRVIGTLGVLDEAAQLGLVEFQAIVERLRETSFRMPPEISGVIPRRNRAR